MATHVGNLVRAARHHAQLRLEDLADAVRLTPGALSHIESGRRLPGPANAIAIAKALNIPQDAIMQALDQDHAARRRSSVDPGEFGFSAALPPSSPRPAPSPTASRESAFYEQPIEAMFDVQPGGLTRNTAGVAATRGPDNSPRVPAMRHTARWSVDTSERLDALGDLADSAASAIRTLRGLVADDDPAVSREARRLLRELDVQIPDE